MAGAECQEALDLRVPVVGAEVQVEAVAIVLASLAALLAASVAVEGPAHRRHVPATQVAPGT